MNCDADSALSSEPSAKGDRKWTGSGQEVDSPAILGLPNVKHHTVLTCYDLHGNSGCSSGHSGEGVWNEVLGKDGEGVGGGELPTHLQHLKVGGENHAR